MVRTDHGSTLPIAALFREGGRMFRVVVIYSFTWYSSNILQYLRASIRRRSSEVRRRSAGERNGANGKYERRRLVRRKRIRGDAARGATRNLRATRLLTLSRRVP